MKLAELQKALSRGVEGGVLSMAQKARQKLGLNKDEGLDQMYGICYFIPTMHTHPTFFAFKEWVEFSDHGMEWKADPEREHTDYAVSAAHYIILHVLKTHNDFYNLGLDDELEQRSQDYAASWTLSRSPS